MFKIQGNYGETAGWEDVSNGYDTRAEAEEDLRKYEVAEPYARHRVVPDE